MKKKTLGIIGGMGAAATADLFQKIVAVTDAKNDREHIPVVIDNNTMIPDRTAFLLSNNKRENPKKDLIESAEKLRSYGAEILMIACNTAHYFFTEIQSTVDIPIINMVEETAKEVAKKKHKCVGILATEGFIQFVDYKQYYDRLGIDTVCPNNDEQKYVNELIYNGIKSQNYDIDLTNFIAMLECMSTVGVESFVLACTELPIAFSCFNLEYPIIDSNIVLAKKAVIDAGGKIRTGF